jgi:Resolvase, N terminal domain
MKGLGGPLESTTSTKGGRRKENVMLTKRKREENDWKIPRVWRAVIYLSEPSLEGAGKAPNDVSIDRQRLLCRCVATVLHAEVVGEFVDERMSPLSRPGFRQMMDLVRQHPRLDYLIVSSMDRLIGESDAGFEIAWSLGFAGTLAIPADAEHEFPWTGATPPS